MHAGRYVVDEQELVARVKERAALRTAHEAHRALEAAVGALRCALANDDAIAIARELPARLTRILERAASSTVHSARALYDEALRRERVGAGFGVEHVQVVLQVLAELLDPESVVRLRKRLPPDIADLLRARTSSVEPPVLVHEHPAQRSAPRQTLSRARPGTTDPIAEADHVLAHEYSVARSPASHSERWIGTARSTRPEREDETLATSRSRERPK